MVLFQSRAPVQGTCLVTPLFEWHMGCIWYDFLYTVVNIVCARIPIATKETTKKGQDTHQEMLLTKRT
eukprot:6473897-Amphidinium_carterae.1